MRGYFFFIPMFFLCGLCTVLNTILAPYLKQVLHLSHTSITLIYLSFYLAYFCVAPLSGYLFRKGNYLSGIRIGLSLSALGSLFIFFGGTYHSFLSVLAGLFVMASGISMLQVNGNPYLLHLGSKDSATSRLSFVQGFYALGAVAAPFIGSFFILSTLYHPEDGTLIEELLDILPIQKPYFILAAVWGIVLLLSEIFPLPAVSGLKENLYRPGKPILKSSIVWLGMLVIALAVGVEVSLGNYVIPLLSDPSIMDLTLDMAGHLAIIYWLGFMLGRFINSFLLKDLEPRIVLYYHAAAGLALCLLAIFTTGLFAGIAALTTGLCTSILFPILFSLILEECPDSQMKVSGYLVMANIGGGLIPLLQGLSADSLGIHLSFFVPGLCFLAIALFSLRRPKLTLQPIRVRNWE